MASTDEGVTEEQAYVEHPLLAESFIERRLYQLRLAGRAAEGHTLVCLPTGLGKTTVSLLVTARRLDEVGGRALFLAPTKPLVQQHADFYREALTIDDEEVVVFTGEVAPEDRAALWADARIVIATPQVVENDLIGGRISLADVTHCTFDECHRATGDYAYTYIAERYHADADEPLVTGMSASPGGDAEEIETVCANLGIEAVEVMTSEDADVDEYTHETDVEWQTVELPEDVAAIRDALTDVIEDRLDKLRELGVTRHSTADLSQRDLNEMRAKLQALINSDKSEGYQGMSVHAEIMKLRRAVTLAETQSVEALRRYFERQREDARSSGASKASQRFVSDPQVREAMRRAESHDALHPKFERTRTLLAETLGLGDGERVIVFTESRDTAEVLTEFLNGSFDARRFVGQGDKQGSDGMTQTEQQETLDRFRDGEFEVLVSTSVAEEGLDVPEVDLVLFYEPVPTAIRSIQRKGRTGRQTEGRVVVLMVEDTRDEAYFWISRRREQEMEDELRSLKEMRSELTANLGSTQAGLGAFEDGSASGSTRSGVGSAGRTDGTADFGADATARPTGTAEATGDAAPARQPGLTDFADRGDPSGDDGGDDPEDAGGDDPEDAGGEDVSRSDESDDRVGSEDSGDESEDSGDESEDSGDGSEDSGDESEDSGDESEDSGDESEDSGDGSEDSGDESEDSGGDRAVPRPDEDEEVTVVIDQRELDSTIARDLSTRESMATRLETLAVGDYVLSDRVAVERKSTADFVDSLLDGDRSMFEQVGALARHYARPVVVVEGDSLYEERDVHPNAIRGALASLAVDYDASVLHTADESDTAELLAVIAGREQEVDGREVSVHGEKGGKTLGEQQEYVVASIAEVGPVTARALLSAFGTVEGVMCAREEDLLEVDGVGEVTADRIREVVGSEYTGK